MKKLLTTLLLIASLANAQDDMAWFQLAASRPVAGGGESDPLTNGLVGWWKLDGDYLDSSPIGTNFGTAGTGVTWTNGVNGVANTAAHLSGGTNYIRIGSGADFNFGTNNFTLAGWVKFDTGAGQCGIFEKRLGTGGFPQYKLRNLDVGGVTWDFETYNTVFARASNGEARVNNKWIHVAGVRDGTTMTLYTNAAVTAVAINQPVNDVSSTAPLGLGNDPLLGAAGDPLLGSLDEMRAYNRALTPTEVTNLYLLDKP